MVWGTLNVRRKIYSVFKFDNVGINTQLMCALFPFLLLFSVGNREPLEVSKWGREKIRLIRRTLRLLRSEEWKPKQEGDS